MLKTLRLRYILWCDIMLIKYELKKIISRVFIGIFVSIYVVYSLITALSIFSDFSYKHYYGLEKIKTVYFEYQQSTLDSDIAINNYNIVNLLTSKLLSDANRKNEYIDEVSSIIRQAKYHLLSYEKENISPDSYTYKHQEHIIQLFTKAFFEITIGFEPYLGWDIFFSNNVASYCVYSLLIMYLVVCFYNDKSKGNDSIVTVTRNGRVKYIIAKLTACIIILIIGICLGESIRLLLTWCHHGLSSVFNNIQAFKDFTANPYDLTILEYLLFYFITKIISSIALLCSSIYLYGIIKNLPVYCIIYTGISIVDILRYTSSSEKYVYNLLYCTNDFLKKYKSICIFNNLLSYQPLILISSCTITIIICIIIVICYRQIYINSHMSIWRKIQKKYLNKEHGWQINSTSLIWHELYKLLLLNKRLLVILLPLLIICVDQWIECIEKSTYTEEIYRQQLTLIEGEYTNEKHEYLTSEFDETQAILSREKEMEVKYVSGMISLVEYQNYLNDFYAASTNQYIFSDLIDKANLLKYYQQQYGLNGSFVYESGYELINNDTQIMPYIVIIVLSLTSYLAEYSVKNNTSCMAMILYTSKTSKHRLLKIKTLLTISINVFVWLTYKTIRVLIIQKYFPITHLAAQTFSVANLESISFNLTLNQFYSIYILYIVIITASITTILMQFSQKIKKECVITILLFALIFSVIANFMPQVQYLNMFNFSQQYSIEYFTDFISGNVKCILTILSLVAISISVYIIEKIKDRS